MKIKNPLFVLIVSAFAAFLATFNETFLNIAFTPIMQDFRVSVSTVQWLTTAYMLGAAIMVPIASFFYRKYPTKKLFLFTVLLLIVGSIICCLAQDFNVLLTGRIIQSLGTGLLIPIGMNMTLSVVPKEKIGTYMGIMGAMTTLGPSLSIISAGALLSIGNWKILFIVFTVLACLLFLVGLIILRKNEKLENPKLDVFSVTLISLSLIGILYGISTLFSGNIVLALIALILGLLLLVIFTKRQLKIKEPLINLTPLSIAPFKVGILLNMFALMLVFAMNIVMPLYIQNALEISSLGASLTLFPAVILSCVMSPIAGKLYDKQGGKNILPLGFFLMFIFILLIGITREISSIVFIALLYIPVICGSALIIGPVQSFALSHLTRELNPHGVTMMSTGFQIAGCVGSSIFTGVYALVMNMQLEKGISNNESLSSAFLVTLVIAALLALLGCIIALSVRKFEIKKENVKNLTLANIMKKNVYSVDENEDLLSVMNYIVSKKVSGVPVINKKQELVGFVSDGDILKYLSKSHPLFSNAYSFAAINDNSFDEKLSSLMSKRVNEIARKKVVTINIDTDIEEVCKILNDKHLKKAPIIENGKMVGMINRSNITKYATEKYLKQAKDL